MDGGRILWVGTKAAEPLVSPDAMVIGEKRTAEIINGGAVITVKVISVVPLALNSRGIVSGNHVITVAFASGDGGRTTVHGGEHPTVGVESFQIVGGIKVILGLVPLFKLPVPVGEVIGGLGGVEDMGEGFAVGLDETLLFPEENPR